MNAPVIRTLAPSDVDMLFRHYYDLDPESKGCRFGVQVSETALRQFISRLDLNEDVHFAVIQDEHILALAQVARYDKKIDNRLELGISVATNARRKGYANLLWESVIAYVKETNMHELHVLHSARNQPMMNFCRSKNMRMEFDSGERIGIWTNPEWSGAQPKNELVSYSLSTQD